MLGELFVSLMPVVLLFATMTMLVLRAGASRIFFDVVGSFQATRLIGDAQAKITVLQGLVLDGLSGITEGVGLIGEQMNTLVDSTVPLAQEIGYARIEFEKFLQASDDADVLGQQIENLGLQFGFSGDQALAAGAKMAQLSSIVGGGAVIPAATEVGIAFGMVGGMETEEAMKRLINLQQQTGFMYGDLTKAQYNRLSAEEKANIVRGESISMLNQLNTIENRSSATMAQVTHVMNQFASSARLAGDDISFMAAMSATLIEAGEEQGKAGRALKMIYARLGADTNNNSEILRKYGIEVKDTNGQLRSMEEILHDITSSQVMATSASKQEVAQAIAGNDHYVRAIKLMEGYERSVQLNTMAVNELDTAQEELNKRFEDNAFLLTQAEAGLTNAKASLGEQFTPAVIRATNAQARLTQAFSDTLDFASQIPILGGVIEGTFNAIQIGRIYAPFVEANLNIMSLNVSLQTQLQIQRALAGQDIVRASAYGQQGSLLRANLGTISQQASMEDRRALIAISSLEAKGQGLNLDQQALRLSQGEVTNDRLSLLARKKSVDMSIFDLQTRENLMNTQKIMNPILHQETQQRKQQLQLQMKKVQKEQDSLKVMSQEQAYLTAAQGHARYRNQEAQRLMSYKAGHFMHTKAEEVLEQNKMNILQRRMQLEQVLIELQNQKSSLGIVFNEEDKHNLNIKQLQSQELAKQLALEGERAIFAAMTGGNVAQNATAYGILGAAYERVGTAVKQTSNMEVQNNMIMEAAEIAARELAIAFGLDEAALREIIPLLPQFQMGLKKVKDQSDMVVNSAMAMNNMLMKSSAVLGAGSMAFSFFGEDAKAARASMILMNFSMIPMTLQMFSSTKASYGLMKGTQGASTGMNTLAASTTRAGVALNFFKTTLGPILLVLAAMGALYALMPSGKSQVDNLTTGFNDLGQNISYSKDMYQSLANELSSGTLENAISVRADKEKEVADMRESLANITEAKILKVRQAELDIAEKELAVLRDITVERQAQQFILNTADAEGFYDSAKLAQSLEQDMQDEAGYNRIFGSVPTGIIGDFLVNTLDADKIAPNVFYSDDEVKAVNAYNEAMSQIPEHLKGAVLEAAYASSSFEEFMTTIESMANKEDFENPFADFGNSIEDNFIGPIEAAKEAAFEFSNAREEMFFGMSKGNLTGDMVKQVVNKGVETLINTTEVIMTNNFTGMTTTQAANEITKQVVEQLNAKGLNLSL